MSSSEVQITGVGGVDLNSILKNCVMSIPPCTTGSLCADLSMNGVNDGQKPENKTEEHQKAFPGYKGPEMTTRMMGLLNTNSASATTMTITYMTDFNTINDPVARKDWCKNRYNTLVTNKQIPESPALSSIRSQYNANPDYYAQDMSSKSPSGNDIFTQYNTDIQNFMTTIAYEYCWYQKRYILALQNFLAQYQSASIEGNAGSNLNELKDVTLELNKKVNTLISLINYIANDKLEKLKTMESEIKNLNDQLGTSTDNLRKQGDILERYNKENTLYKEMVNYTTEKNKAHENLMATYFTLNVVAIVSLFIIARTL